MIIKIVTISLMAVFYICYFAKLISQKKQGIKTDQLGKGKEGFEYSNAIVHAFQRFRAPFSGKIVHIFPEQSAVI